MAYQIDWTERATEDFLAIVNYLEQDWSQSIAENFIITCYKKLDILEKLPFIGAVSSKITSVRRVLITKHIALYYQVNGQTVLLLNFFDMRQASLRNPFE
jgi:plasmid stabilization system protein ParE